ncbi:MAG: Na/Pi cotransporter family protein [Proteobacteria bacterium]|nr:Na/Pi cotransporter family protein [Pseudomonadota bacterium]
MDLLGFFALLGGVGLFLYGMSIMSTGLKNAAGDQLKTILEHATGNRFSAVFIGLLVTILIQSSAATDMMVIGFVNSSMMTLLQAIGVIMGANIGTTITAQITAFSLGAYAPLILFIGAMMCLFVKKTMIRHIGAIILGFGMLFLGISIISSSISPLSQSPEFIQFLQTLEHPALAVLFGVLFTALLQSSSSSVVIFQTFAIQGIISFEMAVYLVIGAAIGSVTPNILASLTTNRNGKRTAILNLVFNLLRASILLTIIALIPQSLELIKALSPDNIGRQVANAHTIFAVIAVILLLPFTTYLVKIAQKIIPILPAETAKLQDRQLLYMQEGNLPPAVALYQAKLEITRMAKIAYRNLQTAVDCFFKSDDKEAEHVEETELSVNYLTHAITQRLVKIRTLNMTGHERNRISQMTLVVADIERISDHAENIVEYENQVKSKNSKLSDEAIEELRTLATLSLKTIAFCIDIFEHETFEKLPEAEQFEQSVDDLEKKIVNNHIQRLLNQACDPLAGVVFTNMSSDLERCSDHAINIAFALHEYDFGIKE